jgi:hypothetical protein
LLTYRYFIANFIEGAVSNVLSGLFLNHLFLFAIAAFQWKTAKMANGMESAVHWSSCCALQMVQRCRNTHRKCALPPFSFFRRGRLRKKLVFISVAREVPSAKISEGLLRTSPSNNSFFFAERTQNKEKTQKP